MDSFLLILPFFLSLSFSLSLSLSVPPPPHPLSLSLSLSRILNKNKVYTLLSTSEAAAIVFKTFHSITFSEFQNFDPPPVFTFLSKYGRCCFRKCIIGKVFLRRSLSWKLRSKSRQNGKVLTLWMRAGVRGAPWREMPVISRQIGLRHDRTSVNKKIQKKWRRPTHGFLHFNLKGLVRQAHERSCKLMSFRLDYFLGDQPVISGAFLDVL